MADPNDSIAFLRSLVERMPENKDLPPPRFFMDPRSMSMANILKGGAGTTLDWLASVKGTGNEAKPGEGYGFAATGLDPSDTLAPLGLAPMGMALTPKNAIGSAGGRLTTARPVLEGEILESPAAIIRRGQQSQHWPENWFSGPGKPTERSQDALLDAARHALERDAADAWDAIVQPLRAKYGDKLRAEAEAYAIRPDLGDAFHAARREFMEGRKGRPLTDGEMMWEGLDRKPGVARPTGADLLDTVAREKFFVTGHPELSQKPAISSDPKLLKADTTRSSVPGAVVNAQEERNPTLAEILMRGSY